MYTVNQGAGGNINEEVDAMIKDLQLEDKKKIQASQLSGGMKRKLRYMYT